MEVLICEKCNLIHPKNYDGMTCRNSDCKGKLIPIKLSPTILQKVKEGIRGRK